VVNTGQASHIRTVCDWSAACSERFAMDSHWMTGLINESRHYHHQSYELCTWSGPFTRINCTVFYLMTLRCSKRPSVRPYIFVEEHRSSISAFFPKAIRINFDKYSNTVLIYVTLSSSPVYQVGDPPICNLRLPWGTNFCSLPSPRCKQLASCIHPKLKFKSQGPLAAWCGAVHLERYDEFTMICVDILVTYRKPREQRPYDPPPSQKRMEKEH
jgi:hypothetical protein